MNFEIRFIPAAENSYETLIEQLRERWGDKYVEDLDIRIATALNKISAAPYLYQITDQITGTRKCVLHKNCSMFYKVYESVSIIQIILFWDNRQEPLFL